MATMVDGDVSITATGDIRWTGATSTYNTVLEFHRWLMDKADDAIAAVGDLMDITFKEPSDRSTDNIITLLSPYNIDDTMAEQLFDGSVTQDNGDTVYSGLEVKGVVVSDTELVIIQDGTILTSWWDDATVMINDDPTNLIILRTLIKSREFGVDIDGKKILLTSREWGDTYSEFPVTLGLGNSTGAISTEDDLNNNTLETTVNAWLISNGLEGYQTIDLNNGNGAQPYYSQWDKHVQSINGLYEFSKDIQRRGNVETIHGVNGALFRGISHQWDYDGEVTGFTTNDILAWGATFTFETGVNVFTVGDPVTVSPSGATGQVAYYSGAGATGTMVIQLDPGSAQITNADAITEVGTGADATCDVLAIDTLGDQTTGGTGILLADDSADTVWIQLLTGNPPADNNIIRGQGLAATVLHSVAGSFTARTIRPVFLGQSTGLAIIGSFGFGVEAADLLTADAMTDLLNAPQSPPNNQEWTASGLATGEDYVMVALNDGVDEIDYDQFTIDGALSGATTTVIVNEVVPTWIPQTGGSIRVKDDNDIYIKMPITSYVAATKTFTVTSTSITAANGNLAFAAAIDILASGASEAFTGIYTGDISLVVKSRDGGGTPEKPFRVPSTFNSGGGGTIVQHVSDA